MEERRLTFFVPDDMWERLRFAAVKERKTIKALMQEIIAEWLEKREGGGRWRSGGEKCEERR